MAKKAKFRVRGYFKDLMGWFKLMKRREEWIAAGDPNSIDLSDDSALQLTYLDRFAVKMPWTADMDYKLQSIAAVVERLEENETGTINLMTDGKASFVPGKV